MKRTKVDYGIDLGTTNSAIARMQNGKIEIIKSLPDRKKETTPSCINFKKNESFTVGDSAFQAYKTDSIKALSQNKPLNIFVEFKRTMGTDKVYTVDHSPKYTKELSSEELSAEILKRLKEYVSDDNITSAIITVPAAFKTNQIDATRKAAKLAGFDFIEVLQEPVAAAMAYGVDTTNKNGFWLVFDFGGGTFDAALLRVEEGIMNVIDTEGDNYLGGKNLDYAILDQLIIPHIQKEFNIDETLQNDTKKAELREALKFFAEEIKNNLSFNASYNLYIDPGDCGEDDEGEEIEVDLTVSHNDLRDVLAPVFQKAINCSLELLQRNNLSGTSLESLILVGGPTLSPVIREMLTAQICTPDTSVDPMTVVSKGAALFASTIPLPEAIVDQQRDKTKIQLEISHSSSTIETEEFVTLKILEDKTEGEIPENVLCEIKRSDNTWNTGKVPLNSLGEIVEVHLAEEKANLFEIQLYDDLGNSIASEPNTFTILHGSVVGAATLPYNVGIEIQDIASGKLVFTAIQGLEKNKTLPAEGYKKGLISPRTIRPNNADNFLKISIYEGEHGAEGSRVIHNHHVNTIMITGNDIPTLLPEGSEVDITLYIDTSRKITGKAYFPTISFEYEFECETIIDSIETDWLANEFQKGIDSVNDLKSNGHISEEVRAAEKEIIENKMLFEKAKEDTDTKQQALSNLRKSLKTVDDFVIEGEWPAMEQKLKEAFRELEQINQEKGSDNSKKMVSSIRRDMKTAINNKDKRMTLQLLDVIKSFSFELERLEHLVGFIINLDNIFITIPWTDSASARNVIDRAKSIIYENPSIEKLQPLVSQLIQNGNFSDMLDDGSDASKGTLKGRMN